MQESDDQASSYNRVWHAGLGVSSFRTACAKVDILSTPDFGTVIFLDGEVQSSSADQETYHQTLTWPALTSRASAPSNALIVGGGELCTLRQVLKYPGIKSATMIDYDAEFVAWCKKNLVAWHKNTWMDSRATIKHEDIYGADLDIYDTIIVDMTDLPLGSAAFAAEEPKFRQLVRKLLGSLTADGVMTMYLGMWIDHKSEAMKRAIAIIKEIVGSSREVVPYRRHIASFGTGEAFFCLVGKDGWFTRRGADHFGGCEVSRAVLFDCDFD